MAWYRAGTVIVTNGSNTVTGVNTAWVANARVGDEFMGPDGGTYEIANIASDTALSILSTSGGGYDGETITTDSSGDGANYAIKPTQGYTKKLADQAADILNNYAGIANAVNNEWSTASTPTAALEALGTFINLVTAADAETARSVLELGTAAIKNTGTSGDAVPLLNAANTWSESQVVGTASSNKEFTTYNGRAGSFSKFTPDADNSPGMQTYDAASGLTATYRMNSEGITHFFRITSGGDARGYRIQNGGFLPVGDNFMSCGDSTHRWTQLYALNTTISTSDATLKTSPRDISSTEVSAFAKISRLPMVWQWLTKVDEEGDSARLHSGPTVQAAIQVMTNAGLDWTKYSAFCYDSWERTDAVKDDDGNVISEAVPAGEVFSFRKEELLLWCFRSLVSQYDEILDRIEALEAS